ncbi:MAG: hypothetical protein UT97_C0028G0001 [Parcubacteria group bacterium GW2011_GWC2_40_31]|nr:MAG: hypothetical protein UT97_C0028G0001 [Parcubacteria group bacterium GW2011_GWC2_40_31]
MAGKDGTKEKVLNKKARKMLYFGRFFDTIVLFLGAHSSVVERYPDKVEGPIPSAPTTMKKLTLREKSILAGLYLSKFDTEGLKFLGFNNFTEAFNVIGLALSVKPASVKNYRDEFDPLFPNERQGWHKREIRPYCKDIFNIFKDLDIANFSNLLKEIIYENHELDVLMEQIAKKEDKESSFAKRLITGQAAEHYFKENYTKIEVFKNYQIEDTTKYGCGFDFKLCAQNTEFLGVEVKELNNSSGNFALTSKEYSVAQLLGGRYFLFVVKNFKEVPFHDYFQNPLNSKLKFNRIETIITQVSYNTAV